MGLFGWGQKSPDKRLGTGLWRHHHDRFMRVVDRFYLTAQAVHAQAQAAPEPAASTAVELLAQQTVVLNQLADEMAGLTAQLHQVHPVNSLVLDAAGRRTFGQLPELMSRAGAKVGEAAQAAAMCRVALRAGQDGVPAAEAAAGFVADAQAMLAAGLALAGQGVANQATASGGERGR